MKRSVQLSFDRVEGRDENRLAVLVSEDGQQINFPLALLPDDARPGDSLKLAFTRDLKKTRSVARRSKRLRDELGKSDPGGDVTL